MEEARESGRPPCRKGIPSSNITPPLPKWRRSFSRVKRPTAGGCRCRITNTLPVPIRITCWRAATKSPKDGCAHRREADINPDGPFNSIISKFKQTFYQCSRTTGVITFSTRILFSEHHIFYAFLAFFFSPVLPRKL